MAIKDLREWIKELEEQGEVARIKEKVDWNLEIGGITQETFDRGGPALLFENIKDRSLSTRHNGSYEFMRRTCFPRHYFKYETRPYSR